VPKPDLSDLASYQKCHPERSGSRTLRIAQSKDLQLALPSPALNTISIYRAITVPTYRGKSNKNGHPQSKKINFKKLACFSPPKTHHKNHHNSPQIHHDLPCKNHTKTHSFFRTPFKNARKNSKTPALTRAKLFSQILRNLTRLKHLLDPPQRLPSPLLILNQRKPHMPIPMLAKPHARAHRNLRLQQQSL